MKPRLKRILLTAALAAFPLLFLFPDIFSGYFAYAAETARAFGPAPTLAPGDYPKAAGVNPRMFV